ncbi:MAG: hypothetical protein Fur0037_00820 [Planctomycetota bacterium]
MTKRVPFVAREGVTTGFSAKDRAHTIRTAVDPNARPCDLVRPGHIAPLRARDGGVLVRNGQGIVDPCRLTAAGADYLPIFREKRIPDSRQKTSFWQALFAHAAAKKDVPLFREILGAMKEIEAGDPRLKRYLGTIERQLEELEKSAGR